VLYSLTEIETKTDLFSLRETEMFCKTKTKYKRESEHIKRNKLIETKLISQRKWLHKMFLKFWHFGALIC